MKKSNVQYYPIHHNNTGSMPKKQLISLSKMLLTLFDIIIVSNALLEALIATFKVVA